MKKLSANVGWLWVKEGFAIFRKQPAEMLTLFFFYLFLMLTIGVIPILGQILPLVLVPVFSMTFMHACDQIEQKKRVYPSLILAGFRSPALRSLLSLGVLYFVAAIIAVAGSVIVDDGAFWKMMTGQIQLNAKNVRETNMTSGMLFSALLYTPAAMGFWYAAPLIAWQKMSLGKSIFYSFFTVRKLTKAFLVYGLAWAVIGILLPAVISTLVAIVIGKSILSILILLPLSMVLTLVMYCSFYSTYISIFGKPDFSTNTNSLG